MKNFEDLTIKELRKLTQEFKEHNPDFQTAQELLDEKFEEKESEGE